MYTLKIIIVPLLTFVGLLVCFVIAAQLIVSRISPLRDQITTSSEQETALRAKLATLSSIDSKILEQSDTAYVALPDQNPAAVVMSQVRKVAANNSLSITSVSASAINSTTDLSTAAVEIKARGEVANLFAFVAALKNLAPLINIDRTKIVVIPEGKAELQISVNTYWAAFPQKLPALSQPIEGLSEDEVNLLSKLIELQKPDFARLTPSAPSEPRQDPFVTSSSISTQ
jgi:Tfp pilus assembly protein PilO